MSDLIAIVYPDVHRAAVVLDALQRLERAHLLDLEDACVVTRDRRGRVRLHQSVNLPARGAVGGMFWGTLIGLVTLNPLVGLATGAAAGAVAGTLIDHGISDDFMRELGEQLVDESSALFVLVRHATTSRVEPELARFGGRLLHTSLDTTAEARLGIAISGAPHARALPPAAALVALPRLAR